MIVAGSEILILIVGVAVCVLAAWGIFAPGKLTHLVKDVMDHSWGIYVAVGVRLLLGAALIIAAPVSRYPFIFQALGWIAIIAAIVLMFIGRERLRSLVAWFDRFSETSIRVWLVFAIALGGFLLHGIS